MQYFKWPWAQYWYPSTPVMTSALHLLWLLLLRSNLTASSPGVSLMYLGHPWESLICTQKSIDCPLANRRIRPMSKCFFFPLGVSDSETHCIGFQLISWNMKYCNLHIWQGRMQRIESLKTWNRSHELQCDTDDCINTSQDSLFPTLWHLLPKRITQLPFHQDCQHVFSFSQALMIFKHESS